MAQKNQNNLSPKEKLQIKKMKKIRRKALLKSALAIFLVLLMIGMVLSPVFAEESISLGNSQTLVSDRQIHLSANAPAARSEEVLVTDENFHEYIDFMMKTVENNYFKDVQKQFLVEGAYKGIFTALDPYSTYFTPKEYQSFNTSLEGEFSGIGASITEGKNGYIEVVAPIKGTPADKAGLFPGDMIVEINGTQAKGFTTEKAVTLIRGEKGTHVILKIKRVGSDEVFTFDIIRDTIIIKSVEYKLLENNIGYIQIVEFTQKTNAEFDAAMAYMMNKDVKKLIVDVRNNPGGLLDTAIHVSDYFIPMGKEIVKIDYKGTNDRVYRATTEKSPADVVVLTNKGSASASEIFAGSIQKTGSGKVIGETSFGKGTVQSLLPLKNGGAVKVTIAEYKLTNDVKVNGVGIVPDIKVAAPAVITTEIASYLAPMDSNAGQSALNIYSAQQRLKLLGYEVTSDGKLGTQTTTAIKEFQGHYKIKQTSVLDKITMEALMKATALKSERVYDPQLAAAIDYFK